MNIKPYGATTRHQFHLSDVNGDVYAVELNGNRIHARDFRCTSLIVTGSDIHVERVNMASGSNPLVHLDTATYCHVAGVYSSACPQFALIESSTDCIVEDLRIGSLSSGSALVDIDANSDRNIIRDCIVGGGSAPTYVVDNDGDDNIIGMIRPYTAPSTRYINDTSDGLIHDPIESYLFVVAGGLSVGSSPLRLPFTRPGWVVDVRAMVDTAPTGASLIVDVNKDGTTIFTTQANRPTIAASANDSGKAVPDVELVAAGSYLTIDVDQVGSTVAGSDLGVLVRWRPQ